MHLSFLFVVAVVALFICTVEATGNGASSIQNRFKLVCTVTTLLLSCMPSLYGLSDDTELPRKTGHSSPHIPRTRRFVHTIFNELGPIYVRRAFHMHEDDFWFLHRLLRRHLGGTIKPKKGSTKKHRNGAKNGLIPSPIWLSAAIRYFAGGSPYDIAVMHGISHTEVFNSVWKVVDALNKFKNMKRFAIKYPQNHDEQRKIAAGFKAKSDVRFDNCAGCIDGMLVWIEKPYLADCEVAECGPKRFFCGRKKKFGLNLQGTCDHHGRFLDISICHPASTSDYLSFTTSKLYTHLEEKNLLAPGLSLFGDCAYVNTSYMATPFKNVTQGTKDDYNFYHSQVRISIECAFSMLVNRWGILRCPIPAKIGLRKTTAMVVALCRLHNYCIGRHLEKLPVSSKERDIVMDDIEESLAKDHLEIETYGGFEFERRRDGLNDKSPEEILHGGDHFDDVNRAHRRWEETQHLKKSGKLPRDRLHEHVARIGYKRPMPVDWKK